MMGSLELLNFEDSFLLLNILIQISLMATFAIIAAKKFKNSAATRYAILYTAMLSLPVLLILSVFMQMGEKSLFYLPVEALDVSSSYQYEYQAAPIDYASGVTASWEDESQAVMGFGDALHSAYTEYLPAVIPSVATFVADSESTAFLVWQWFISLSFNLQLSILWFVGFAVQGLGLARSFHKIKSLANRSSSLSEVEQEKVKQCLGDIEIDYKRVGIAISREVSSPVVMGYLNSTLVLPEGFVPQLAQSELRAVLLHELAHVERFDALKNLIQKCLLAFFWFHPLVHIMDRMISIAREEICDNYVLSRQKPLDYGEVLLSVSNLQSCRSGIGNNNMRTTEVPLAMGVLGNEWKLEQRISELLSERREKTMKLSKPKNHIVRGSLASVSILLAACQVGAAENVNVEALDAQDRELAEQQQAMEMNARDLQQEADGLTADADRIQREQVQEFARQHERQHELAEEMGLHAQRMNAEAMRIDREAREMARELREQAVELSVDLDQVREQVRQDLEEADIGSSIRESVEELRADLAELEAQPANDAHPEIQQVTRQALQTALRSLEAIDVEALESDIWNSLEFELEGLENLEIDLNIDFDPEDIDPDVSFDRASRSELEALRADVEYRKSVMDTMRADMKAVIRAGIQSQLHTRLEAI